MAALKGCTGSDCNIFQSPELSETMKIPVSIADASRDTRTGYLTNTRKAFHSLTSSISFAMRLVDNGDKNTKKTIIIIIIIIISPIFLLTSTTNGFKDLLMNSLISPLEKRWPTSSGTSHFFVRSSQV
jgi:hypothetical protein